MDYRKKVQKTEVADIEPKGAKKQIIIAALYTSPSRVLQEQISWSKYRKTAIISVGDLYINIQKDGCGNK